MQSCNTDVGLSPQCSKGFFTQSTIIADSYSVHTAPVCNHMHQQPYQCLDTQKYCTDILHALIGMGSTALAAAVSYEGKAI